MTLSDRDAAFKHRYRLFDGTPVPSVTAISGLLDIDGKSAKMAGAAARITREGGQYRKEWDAKRDRGTRLHGHLEAFLRGETIEVREDDAGYVDALEKWVVARNPRHAIVEAIVLSEAGYGGRLDVLDGDVLYDLKSGRVNTIDVTLQLAAYRYADGIAMYDEAGALEWLDAPPLLRIKRTVGLYVRENGTYEEIDTVSDHEAFCAFKQLLDVYRWAKALSRRLLR